MQHTYGGKWVELVLDIVETVALVIEVLAVAVIAIGIGAASVMIISRRFARPRLPWDLKAYREQMGNTLLLGLEILVAADIVRTVALEPTLRKAVTLGVLVLIRTFLSWSLVIEIEQRWPWQPKREVAGPPESSP